MKSIWKRELQIKKFQINIRNKINRAPILLSVGALIYKREIKEYINGWEK